MQITLRGTRVRDRQGADQASNIDAGRMKKKNRRAGPQNLQRALFHRLLRIAGATLGARTQPPALHLVLLRRIPRGGLAATQF